MSYDTVIDQIKNLPEECLDEASEYIDFLLYRNGLNKMTFLTETEEDFNSKMQKGYDDMVQGREKSLKEAFSDIKKRFA